MRFYVSQTIGDGITPETAFRPALNNYIANYKAVDMRTNIATNGLMFVECDPATIEHDAIVADTSNTYIDTGGLNLDDDLSGNANLTPLLRQLESYQIPTDDFSGVNTLRQLLQRITKRFLIRQLLAGSDVPNDLEAFLTLPQQAAAQAKANALGVSPNLTKKSRDIIKEVAAIPHKFLKTHYDN